MWLFSNDISSIFINIGKHNKKTSNEHDHFVWVKFDVKVHGKFC